MPLFGPQYVELSGLPYSLAVPRYILTRRAGRTIIMGCMQVCYLLYHTYGFGVNNLHLGTWTLLGVSLVYLCDAHGRPVFRKLPQINVEPGHGPFKEQRASLQVPLRFPHLWS